ncbi:TetR/AcrR family transcriptional regulator [Gordonia sp. OPL2]|uniref:TetR/AcrR family transcriptional regulator n=1 Tax=Gordonia sp. OPL2 TaxID=2486274 RepID=UPI0016551799|nr:TetR family transcriptional regulator [Gordonia sp. OPL2]
MTPQQRSGRGRGRPRAAATGSDNRESILTAARELFSDRGFDRSTMREIGRRAGVDPALIHHYFGTKDALLVAALRPEIDVVEMFAGITVDTDSPGTEFLRRILGFWESNPEQRTRAIALLRVAVTHAEVAAGMREFFLGIVRTALADVVADDHRDERIGLMFSQIAGLGMARYVLDVPVVAKATPEELAQRVGPNIDRYLSGDMTIESGDD